MANPLAGEAYSIVNKSLETGARGSSTKMTDYSGISDAFMKKASMETQIGGMMMDQQMQRATLMADLDVNKANIHLQMADLALRDSHFQQQRKDAKDADKMSGFEQITGVLAGAASGAAGGAAVGGKPGAIIGGVAGGAAALGAGNSRKAQSNTLQNIGTISNAAITLKGVSNAGKQKDSSAELIKGIGSISGIFRSESPNSEAFQGAQAQLDNYVNKYTADQIKAGRPMGEVYKEAAAYKKEAMQGFDPNDSEMVANRSIAGRIAEAKTDELFMKGDRGAIKQFQMDVAGYHMDATGKAPTRAQMQIYTGRADSGVAESYFSGNSVSAMPRGGNSAGNTGATISGGGPSGAQMKQDVTQGDAIPQQGPSDRGLSTVNYVVPSAAPNMSAGSQAWGMDMDNGTEQMMASASENFNQAAAKDPTIIDKALNRPDGDFERKPGGGILDKIMPMSDYEKQVAIKEGRGPKGSDTSAESNVEATNTARQQKFKVEREEALANMEPAQKTYFTSEDPVEIQNALTGGRELDVGSGEKLKMAATLGTAPAQMNEVKRGWEEFGKNLDKMDNRQKNQLNKDFEMYKYGMGGKSGDMNMESKGGGIAALGGQAHYQEFKTNFAMQMEEAGYSPEETDALFTELIALDSQTNVLQATMAKAGMGGQLSDRDVSMYMLKAVADPDDVKIRKTIEAHQSLQYKNAKALIHNWAAPKSSGGGGRKATAPKPNDEWMPY